MALTARAELFNRIVQRGVYDVTSIGGHPGAIFFANSAHAAASDAAGFGKSPDSPVATIDYAISLCTASAGDVIYAMPQHVETVAAAGGLNFDIAGVHLIGIGAGTIQAQIDFTAEASSITITAANVTIEDMWLQSGFADITIAVDVSAEDFTFRHNRVDETVAGENFLIVIQDDDAAGAGRMTIEDNTVYANDAANTHFVDFGGTGDGHIVRRNRLLGDFTTMAIGGAGVVTMAQVHDNYIYHSGADADAIINFADTATGIVCNNRSGTLGNAAGNNCIIMSLLENYHVNISDANGVLDPIAT